AVPAVVAREVTLEIGVVRALSHGGPPETVAADAARGGQVRLVGGAAGSKPSSSGTRRSDGTASTLAAELRPGGRDERWVAEEVEGGLGDEQGRQERRRVALRRDRRIA